MTSAHRTRKTSGSSEVQVGCQPQHMQPKFTLTNSGNAVVKVVLAMVLVLAGVFITFLAVIPLPEANIPEVLEVFATEQNTDSPLYDENQVVAVADEIPDTLKKAVVAVEDKRFYKHRGIELSSIGRAFMRNLKAGEIVEGGSTITQQLAKNLFLTQDRTLKRKIIEAIYSIKLEMRYSKDEILEMYLNVIYFGHGTYGCEMASRFYFGKPVNQLGLSEAAMLAGIIKGPEIYSPYHNIDLAEQRRIVVLALMARQGDIDPALAEEAKKEKVKLVQRPVSILRNGRPYQPKTLCGFKPCCLRCC